MRRLPLSCTAGEGAERSEAGEVLSPELAADETSSAQSSPQPDFGIWRALAKVAGKLAWHVARLWRSRLAGPTFDPVARPSPGLLCSPPSPAVQERGPRFGYFSSDPDASVGSVGIGPLAGLFLGAVLAGLPPAAHGQGSAPAATQTFKAWALDCLVPKTGEGAGKRVCFVHHEARSPADATLIAARVVVRHAGPDRKLALIVQLPPNSVQASGLSLTVDGNKAYPVAIQACLPKFCYSAIEMTLDLQGEAKAGQQMNLSFTAKDKGAQQVPVPLAGITAALGALEKTGS